MRRRSFLVPLGILLACLVAVPACKKKPAPEGTPDGPAPSSGASGNLVAPPAVSSDYLLFAHLNAKDIRDGELFKEIKQAFAKANGTTEWDKAEGEFTREIGVKPTDIDAATICVTEMSPGGTKFVVVLTADKPINKAGAYGLKPGAKPDARGFYKTAQDDLVHFPDDKTMVVLHPDLAQKYLAGYAKDRTGWPLTAELSKAVSGHTLFATVQLDKLSADVRKDRSAKEFATVLAARSITLTADLKGKELGAAARATFADGAAAGKAKEKANELIGMATSEVEKFLTSKAAAELGALLPAVKEAQRALKATKVEVSGSDLTAAISYKADFDIGTVTAEAVKKMRSSAVRMQASNNLKQLALALHNYASANNDRMPVHGINPQGLPIKDANAKPLLSWRVGLLGHIKQGDLYKQFKLNEPWDSENNKKLIEKMPEVYASVAKPGKPGYTHMQMVIGPKAMQAGAADLKSTFVDGTSNTIAVVEAAEPVIWTKPDDVMFPGKELPKDFRKKFGGQFPGGFYVAMWDGRSRFVPDTVSDKTLAAALTPAGNERLGSDW